MKTLTLFLFFASTAWAGITLPASFHANFLQTITNEKKKSIHYRGTIAFSNQKGIKWRYQKPTQKDVCSDQTNLIVVDHDLEQIAYYQLQKAIDLNKIVQNAQFVRKRVYNATYDDVLYTIQLDTKGGLQRIAYRDKVDHVVLIIFSKMRYSNQELSSKSLHCPTPKTYDIINE